MVDLINDGKLSIVYKNIKELKPYAKNPRINDDAVQYVANSISQFGFKVPIVIDSDNTIVAGHTRIKACEQLGISEIPCIIADDLTEAQIKAFRLADNKTAEFAEWDFDMLSEEINGIDGINMFDFGFDIEGLFPDDEQPETDARSEPVEDFTIYVYAKDASEQERIFDELTKKGYDCTLSLRISKGKRSDDEQGTVQAPAKGIQGSDGFTPFIPMKHDSRYEEL